MDETYIKFKGGVGFVGAKAAGIQGTGHKFPERRKVVELGLGRVKVMRKVPRLDLTLSVIMIPMEIYFALVDW